MAMFGTLVLVLTLSIDFIICQDDIRRPPIIITPRSTANLYFIDGTSAVVNCTSDGFPSPTYQWKRNNTVIVSDQLITVDPTTGTLRIPSISTVQENTYTCIATNTFNNGQSYVVSYSAPVRLWVTRVAPFDSGTSIHPVQEHDYVRLLCSPKTVVGASIIYNWYSSQSISVDMDNNRLYTDKTGNLHFTYIVRDDASNNYLCGISVDGNRYIRLGTTNQLAVTPNSNLSPIKPRLQYSNTGEKALLYSTATLECVFSGYDPVPPFIPMISWKDDSGKVIITGGKFTVSDDGRRLTISKVLEEDERNYFCTGRNSAGEDSGTVFLDVTSGPIFINGVPTDQTVSQYTNAVFNCDTRSASGEKAPSAPVWSINGEKFGPQFDPRKFMLSDDQKILTVKNVTKAADIMCVQCEVSNDVDTVLANACLNVLLPIKIEKEPPLVQRITYGGNVDLTVTASTDPAMTLSYRWEFDNKSYVGSDHPPFMYYNPTTNLAYINTSSLTEDQYGSIGGVYSRVIYHLYDSKVVEIEVVLLDRQAASTAGSGFDWWILGLIIALILLIIIILIIIYVICRKKQEGDYNVDKKETGAGLDPEKELKEKEFNAYSRPVYDEYSVYPDTKPPGDPEYDDGPIGGDDESLGEYGKEDVTYFNEDGSFIGIYQSKKPPPPQPTESSI